MPDLGCWGGQIVADHKDGYSPRSAILKCSCGVRGWHTKNIGYIGARTIYNFAGGCEEMKKMMTCVNECACKGSELSIDKKLMTHVKGCERCREYGL